MPHTQLRRFLDTNGDGSGTTSCSVDGSVVPIALKLQPSVSEVAEIHHLIIYIDDVGMFNIDDFGGDPALANGLLIQVRDKSTDAVVHDLFDGMSIKSNKDWRRATFDTAISPDMGVNRVMTIKITLTNEGQQLRIGKNHYLAAIVQDDLTVIDDMTIKAVGVWAMGRDQS